MRVPAVLALVLLTLSCNPADPPLPPPQPPPGYIPMIALSVVDSGLTDVLLRVQIPDTVQERSVELVRDGGIRHRFRLISADTVVRDDSLLINRLYHYRAYRMRDSVRIDSSQLIGVQTLDTTSHAFTWETQTLGDGNSSALYDVAIINDTLAYAVGEIYLRDSTGQIDPNAWNAAKWNGKRWELKRIPFIGSCSAVDYPPLMAIWAFSHDNVLVTNGGSIVRYDGVSASMDCGMNSLLAGAMKKIWARNPQDVYAVGNNGSIVRYASGTWRRVESGTGLHVYSVHGGRNPLTGEVEVYAVAADIGASLEKSILQIEGDQVTQLSANGISSSLHAVWFDPGRRYFVAGSGLYVKRNIASDMGWQPIHPGVTVQYLFGLSGERQNNIVASGSNGELLHFNGSSWRSFRSIPGITSARLRSCSIKGDLLIAVGYLVPRGFVVVGRRTR